MLKTVSPAGLVPRRAAAAVRLHLTPMAAWTACTPTRFLPNPRTKVEVNKLASPTVTGATGPATPIVPIPTAIVVAVMAPAPMWRDIHDPMTGRWDGRADHHGRGVHRRHRIHDRRRRHHDGRMEDDWQTETNADLEPARPGRNGHRHQGDCCDCDHHFRFHMPIRRPACGTLRIGAID